VWYELRDELSPSSPSLIGYILLKQFEHVKLVYNIIIIYNTTVHMLLFSFLGIANQITYIMNCTLSRMARTSSAQGVYRLQYKRRRSRRSDVSHRPHYVVQRPPVFGGF